MEFCSLKQRFLEFLNDDFWPVENRFREWMRDEQGLQYSDRDYSWLRQANFAKKSLVRQMIRYLIEKPKLGPRLCAEFEGLSEICSDQWVDRLSTDIDGHDFRCRDYFRGVSWPELALTWFLRDRTGENDSFCDRESIARQIAWSQHMEIGRGVLSGGRKRRVPLDEKRIDVALRSRIGMTTEEFVELHVRHWKVIPECFWLVHKGVGAKRKLIGGSVVLPLYKDAYCGIRNGELKPMEIESAHLKIPSRHLWICCLTTLPEYSRIRISGIGRHTARQIRKLAQHCAVLLGRNSESDEPVHAMVVAGSEENEQAVSKLGYTSLDRNLASTECPLYELVTPAPEKTVADFSTVGASHATLVGTAWRLLDRI